MKKITLIFLATAVLAFSTTACSNTTANDSRTEAPIGTQTGSYTDNTAAEPPKTTTSPDSAELDQIKTGKLEPVQMQKLLSLLEGEWYQVDDIEAIRSNGLKECMDIRKKDNQYYIGRSFYDTGVSGKVLSVNKLEGSNRYQIKGFGDNTQIPMEYDITLNDDGKSLYLTSKLYSEGITDKNIKLVKATKELYEQVALKCLAGIYKDSKDRTYEFKESGVAVWPDKTFKFSIDKGIAYNLVEYDANGHEVVRCPFELISKKLIIHALKGNGIIANLRRAESTDLKQKAIDLAADKIDAVVEMHGEDGVTYYKSSLGEVSFICDDIDMKGRYHVRVCVSTFPDGKLNPDTTTGGKEYAVDIKTGNIEEVKPVK